MTRSLPLVSLALLFPLAAVAADSPAGEGGINLFGPTWQQQWYTYFPSTGRVDTPPPEVKVDDGVLRLLDIPAGAPHEAGYIETDDAYRNYRLSLQYRWGGKKFTKNPKQLRSSGILYHVQGPDVLWPVCYQCQVQETNSGDFHIGGGDHPPSMSIHVSGETDPSLNNRPIFSPTGRLLEGVHSSVKRGPDAEQDGWNSIQMVVRGDSSEHYVNGTLVNAGSHFRTNAGEVLDEGHIAIQMEGAEVHFRDFDIAPLAWPEHHKPFSVLVFSKTAGYRHASIPDGIAAIKRLGGQFGFKVDATEDASAFTAENLRQYAVVIFLSTTGDVLDADQQQAFEGYIHHGGGFVGIHAASDTEYDWPWYGRLVGAYFSSHPKQQTATLHLLDDHQTSTSSLPHTWKRFDEWYNFKAQPPAGATLLLAIDEQSYEGGKMGRHPMSWQHTFEGGRAWYTALGHTSESYSEPLFLMHILGGIQYAAGIDSAIK